MPIAMCITTRLWNQGKISSSGKGCMILVGFVKWSRSISSWEAPFGGRWNISIPVKDSAGYEDRKCQLERVQLRIHSVP